MSRDLHFISIEVQSHLYPGLQIRILTPCGVSPPSLTFTSHFYQCLISIQVTRITFQLHPGLTSPHLGLEICTTLPSRFHLDILTHLHPGPDICISPPHRSCLTSIQARNCISAPPKSYLTPIQASRYASQLHSGLSLPPLRSCELNLNFIQVPSHPQPGSRYASHLHPGHVSPPCRSGY